MASFFPEDAETVDGVTPGTVGLEVLAANTPAAGRDAIDAQAESANLTEVATVNPGATGLDLLAAATAAEAQDVLGLSSSTGGSIPTLPVASTNLNYSLDPDRPSLLARLALAYPSATVANMESTTQGFSVDNPANGAVEMVATGGLNPGVERGYIRLTPIVSGGYVWNGTVNTAERIYKDYQPLAAGTSNDVQVWVVGLRVPSSVTPANYRFVAVMLSSSTSESSLLRAGILYTGSAWSVYTDSTAGTASAATDAAHANDVIWIAIVRPAASRSPLVYYSLAGGEAPPSISAMTLLLTHTNALAATTSIGRIGFVTDTGTDTSTAFSGDILYYDDSGAVAPQDSVSLARVLTGAVSVPVVPACGYSPERPELIIAQGICTTGLTQDKLRNLLAACENHRTGLDTASWEWKVERNTSNSYSGGSFAAAGSVVVSGSGPYIRVTVRPTAVGTTPGSLDLVTLRQWSTA